MMWRLLRCMAVLLLVVFMAGLVSAQDAVPLTLDQRVSGEITNDQPEVKYTFSGKADELITVTMMADPDGSSLDSFLTLRNSDGDILAQNDDVLDHISLLVVRLPADGDYTILAGRYNGADGDSEGKYWLEVSDAQLLKSGTKAKVDIQSEFEKSSPLFYVYQPETSGEVKFGFNVDAGGYPIIGLFRWKDNDYPDILIDAEYMRDVSNVTFNADLKANDMYVLMVDPVPVFYNSDETTTLTFSVG